MIYLCLYFKTEVKAQVIKLFKTWKNKQNTNS